MCTVVARWSPGAATQILALRDELTTRDFDEPDFWWPDAPGVVGGRDRLAGGTWCATRVPTGVTALVLNRPQKRDADPGAPSRGVLPLLAAVPGADWPAHVGLDGMASFLLVLARPDRLATWEIDGERLTAAEHPAGTWVAPARGAEDRPAGPFPQGGGAPAGGGVSCLGSAPPVPAAVGVGWLKRPRRGTTRRGSWCGWSGT